MDQDALADLTQIKRIIMFQFAGMIRPAPLERGIADGKKGVGGNKKTPDRIVWSVDAAKKGE